MPKIFETPSARADLSYNGFDMSQRVSFTSSFGHLIPVLYDVLNPDDKINISSVLKSRTIPLDSSAMTSLDEYVDYFFVPLEQIYSAFGTAFFGVMDLKSSLFTSPTSVTEQLPYIQLSQLENVLRRNEYTVTDFQGDSKRLGSNRLLDALGIPASKMDSIISAADDSATVTTTFSISISPILLAAYQKCYYDYYRIEDRESPVLYAYNLDKFYNSHAITSTTDIDALTELHYRPWKKDFFTNTFINPIATSPVQSLNSGVDLNALNQWLTSAEYDYTKTRGSYNNQNVSVYTKSNRGSYTTDVTVLNQAVNPINIRSMFAIDKLLEVTRRAGKTYDKQVMAHFGAKVPNGISGQVMYLGTHKSVIQIGDVISTAETDSQALGTVAGKGYGYSDNNSPIKFSAPCHGVLMAIYSCVPSVDYASLYLDKLNCLVNREDYFIPEYDNLGMQPLFKYQCSMFAPSTGEDKRYTGITDLAEASTFTDFVGWQYRYSELKTKPDRTFGGLLHSLNMWQPTRLPFADAVMQKVSGTSSSILKRNFFVSPFALDGITAVSYGLGTVNDLYYSDPLIHQFYFDYKKSSKMSVYGLPQL